MNNSGNEKGNESPTDSLKFSAEFNGQDWRRREESCSEEQPHEEAVAQSSGGSGSQVVQNDEGSLNSPERDGDFVVTPELLIYEMDDDDIPGDEEEPEDQELEILNQEQTMPIEELFKKYYKAEYPIFGGVSGNQSGDDDDDDDDDDDEDDDEDDDDDDDVGDEVSNNLRSSSRFPMMGPGGSFDEETESEERDATEGECTSSKKRYPRVGAEYQVEPLPAAPGKHSYGAEHSVDEIMWSPHRIPEERVLEYLREVKRKHYPSQMLREELRNNTRSPEDGVPARLPDDDVPLTVLKNCTYKVRKALSSYKTEAKTVPFEVIWTQAELEEFESGMVEFGKDFYRMHKEKVPTKSVKQCILFYYIWKKSPRYNDYKGKSSKKRDHFSPGASNYLERLMDDVEAQVAENNGYAEAFLTHRRALEQHIAALRAEGDAVDMMGPDGDDENTPPPPPEPAHPPYPGQINGY